MQLVHDPRLGHGHGHGDAGSLVQAAPKESPDKVIAKVPVGRLGEPDEATRVVELLAGPESAVITGQIFSVTNGQCM